MPLRNLAQLAPQATALTKLYSLQTGDQFIELRSLIICERGGLSATFRVKHVIGGEGDDPKQYLYYNCPIVPSDSQTFALEIGVNPGDELWVYASTANLSFNLYGR